MTRRRYRSLCLGAFGALAAMTAFAGLAWACTPQAYLELGSSSVSTEGSTVTVTGTRFISGPVQIRLDSDSGPALATATGPDFTTTVKLPKLKRGVYYVYATAVQSDGTEFTPKPRKMKAKAPPNRSEPLPSSEPTPAPARERPRATAERTPTAEPKAAPATSRPALSEAPGGGNAVAPITVTSPAKSPARAQSPAKAKDASTAPAPQPVAIAPLVTSLRSQWSSAAPTAPGLDTARSSAGSSGRVSSLGVGMLVLGLAALGGAGFALVRARPRPPAREATAVAPPVPEPEPVPGSPSLEEELEELIAESAARTQSDVDDAERPAPRVPAGTAR